MSHAIKLKAYKQSLALQCDANVNDGDEGPPRWQSSAVCSVVDPLDVGKSIALCEQVEDLQNALVQATWVWLLAVLLCPMLRPTLAPLPTLL